MDSVPYKFFTSVTSLLSECSEFSLLIFTSSKSAYGKWRGAITEKAKNRQDFDVTFNFRNGFWSYEIVSGGRNFTFDQFRRLNTRHIHVRINFRRGDPGIRSSPKELIQIAKYTAPLVNLSCLELMARGEGVAKALPAILRPFQYCPFSRSMFFNFTGTSQAQFRLTVLQLNSPWMRDGIIADSGLSNSKELRSAAVEFGFKQASEYNESTFTFTRPRV